MSEAIKPLEEVRREIDEIDTALHDLIMRRTRAVEQVAAAKGETDTPGYIPGREVQVLRRLLARHEGAFPRQALVRIWREMIAAFTVLQGPFKVVVCADGAIQGHWDLARDHFGSHATMSSLATPREVVARVSGGEASVGIVPVPAEGEDAWWRMLGGAVAPRIVARLPFIGGSNARDDGAGAYAVAKLEPDSTGDDRALLFVETAMELSRGGLRSLVADANLKARLIVADREDVTAHLIEVEGFLAPEDPAVEMLAARDEVRTVHVVGAYGAPFEGAPS